MWNSTKFPPASDSCAQFLTLPPVLWVPLPWTQYLWKRWYLILEPSSSLLLPLALPPLSFSFTAAFYFQWRKKAPTTSSHHSGLLDSTTSCLPKRLAFYINTWQRNSLQFLQKCSHRIKTPSFAKWAFTEISFLKHVAQFLAIYNTPETSKHLLCIEMKSPLSAENCFLQWRVKLPISCLHKI